MTLEVVQPARIVLVVDDIESVRLLVRELLEAAGFTVLVAGNGLEAIHTSEQFRGDIELLITDVQMPGVHGLALAEHLRSVRPGIHVIFMSADAGEILDAQCVSKLHAFYLSKPFSRAELYAKVNEALNQT